MAACLPVVALSLAAAAEGQTPTYNRSVADAVTGDNPPQTFSHPAIGTCYSCYLPDANGSTPVDSYSEDVYERPTGFGTSASTYYEGIDITSSQVGYDDTWLYYRINLYDVSSATGTLSHDYAFEINFDGDDAGDMLVAVVNPGYYVSAGWGAGGVYAYLDSDQTVGGPNPTTPDGPGMAGNGFEFTAFSGGYNYVTGAPGGSTAVRARIAPDRSASVELAVRRVFLDAVNSNAAVLKAGFRSWAANGAIDQTNAYLHDGWGRDYAGSPHPWLQGGNPPATCPATDSDATTAQISALDGGTSSSTSKTNPCYPLRSSYYSLYPMDNGGTLADLAAGATLQLQVDVQVGAGGSPDPVPLGDTVTLTAVVTNNNGGAGEAADVVVLDSLPAGMTSASATATQGSCTGGNVVSCSLGSVTNGASVTVTVKVVPASLGSFAHVARVSTSDADPTSGNDRSTWSWAVQDTGAVAVAPDGGSTAERLPGGSAHSHGFTVSNTYTATATYSLSGSSGGGGVITVDSLTGSGVTAGGTPTTGSVALAGGASASVTLWYTVGQAAEGSTESLILSASRSSPTDSDAGSATVAVVRPVLSAAVAVSPGGAPLPGDDLTYSLTVANGGSADAESVVVVDDVPAGLSFKVGSVTTSLPAGVSATVAYSDDGRATWTYVPVGGGCGAAAGYDGCVTHVRWTFDQPLSSASGSETASLGFVGRVP